MLLHVKPLKEMERVFENAVGVASVFLVLISVVLAKKFYFSSSSSFFVLQMFSSYPLCWFW